MHDLSFFLLKNWLPVGISAIVFFGIGLLFAKFIWGRYNQRLAFAIEENMNLASQWSALGASQRDLFKKLRVRWQSDRDIWEANISDNENRIHVPIGHQSGSGRDLPVELSEGTKLRSRIQELELALKDAKSLTEGVALGESPENAQDLLVPDLHSRIRDLEQDLIDTHDELHEVRSGYQKQVNLVESLEARLIDAPVPVNGKVTELENHLAGMEAALLSRSSEVTQLSALIPQRNRELRTARVELAAFKLGVSREDIANRAENDLRITALTEELEQNKSEKIKLENDLLARTDALTEELEQNKSEKIRLENDLLARTDALTEELEQNKSEKTKLENDLLARADALTEELEQNKSEKIKLENDLLARTDALTEELEQNKSEKIKLENDLLERTDALTAAQLKVADLDTLQRRKASLQTDLNDACHEMYDVRRALNSRLEEVQMFNEEVQLLNEKIQLLNLKVEEIEIIKGRNRELEENLAATTEALSVRTLALTETSDALAALDVSFKEKVLEGESLNLQLLESHREIEDVRNALNTRLDEIKGLTLKMEDMDVVKSRNSELEETLAHTTKAFSDADQMLTETFEELALLTTSHKEKVLEGEALDRQILEARRELSEVRIAYNEKVLDYQKARAEMEELEAIIEDRTAEVNDLSTEVRTQREQVRHFKNTLAESEGELEALASESKTLNAALNAKATFAEEQTGRVADLEQVLSQRYDELNMIRVDADEYSKSARHFKAQAQQLEDELTRRDAEFIASALRVASAEEAVEAANARISELSVKLEESGLSIEQLQDELRQVSRDKDETIRELERVTRRVEQLENAAQEREVLLAGIQDELGEERQEAGTLKMRLERLSAELESAREEQENSRIGIEALEEALRTSDGRTLQLSGHLEEKDAEVAMQLMELAALKTLVEARETSEVEAQLRLEILQTELETKLASARDNEATMTTLHEEEAKRYAEEIVALEEVIRDQTTQLEGEVEQRNGSLAEIESLQETLEKRTETIRDLQDQISTIMLQRISRDHEISILKDTLNEVEGNLREAMKIPAGISSVQADPEISENAGEKCLAKAIQETLANETSNGEEIPLEDLVTLKNHHTPQAVAPENVVSPKTPGSEEEHVIYFSEAAAALNESELDKIDRCARTVRRYGRKAEITVIGYAGAEGTANYNETLSARRADAVRERLLERGVSQSVVVVRGAGQDRRFADWKARRVEMIVAPVAVAEAVN